jgi:hypothetical protein
METSRQDNHPRPVLTQAKNNTTLWIGHLKTDPNDHFGGQTFICPDDGNLDNIQLYAAAVPCPGDMRLSLHEFDSATKTWGENLGEVTQAIDREDDHQWIRFKLPPIHLKRSESYGFRLETSNALVGLGEAACDNREPFTFGHEWTADSHDKKGHYLSYFSLAFKVELRA